MADKIESLLVANGDCLEWPMAKSAGGYGQKWFSGRVHYIHRFLYCARIGVMLPTSVMVCHTCDNRACGNVSHMFHGPNIDNVRDMVSKGRNVPPVWAGPSSGRASLSEDNVRAIRSSHLTGKDLSRAFSVSESTISNVRNRRTYEWVK